MRLIEADALREEILTEDYDNDTINNFLDLVDFAPTIDAEPVVHAHWKMKIVKTGYWYECSNCGTHWSINGEIHECERTPYCSHCGAKMDEEVEKE